MRDYKKFIVWQRSMELCKVIYKSTIDFPSDEKFGLTAQIRRASISIPSNIAEGAGRPSDKEFARFLDMSVGSLFELETESILAPLGILRKKSLATSLKK